MEGLEAVCLFQNAGTGRPSFEVSVAKRAAAGKRKCKAHETGLHGSREQPACGQSTETGVFLLYRKKSSVPGVSKFMSLKTGSPTALCLLSCITDTCHCVSFHFKAHKCDL
jgi:hypothetical protein